MTRIAEIRNKTLLFNYITCDKTGVIFFKKNNILNKKSVYSQTFLEIIDCLNLLIYVLKMNNFTLGNLPQLDTPEVNNSLKGVVIGNRIPKDYFITKGTGESDITIHAGSYHLALKKAGIERANIMTYSSILPAVANKIIKPDTMVHGAVMETIMAVAHGEMGEQISAGIIYGWLKDRATGSKLGGLVCEHNGSYSVEMLENKLYASLNELYINGFEEEYTLNDIELISESFMPEKHYGTALVAICFTNYLYPLINVET